MQIAHLWRRKDGDWEQKTLIGDEFFFADWSDSAAAVVKNVVDHDCGLIRSGSAASPMWALVTAPGARIQVNGRMPVGGLRVVNDRDAIRTADGARYYFLTESLPVIEPFPAADRPVFCGRCRLRLDSGFLAVRCPVCAIWYHQGGDLPCWTYDERCAYCGAQTALDADYQRIPED